MLRAGGLKAGQYHEVALGSPPAQLAALKAGSIVAASVDPTSAAVAQSQDGAMLVAQAQDFSQLAHETFGLVATTRVYAQSHPQVVQEMARSIAAADAFMAQHPKQSIPSWPKRFRRRRCPLSEAPIRYLAGLRMESFSNRPGPIYHKSLLNTG